MGPETDEVGQAGPICFEILKHSVEPAFQVRRRDAMEGKLQQFFAQDSPKNERRLDFHFAAKILQDGVPILGAIELCQTAGKYLGAAATKVGRMEIGRAMLKWMKKCAG